MSFITGSTLILQHPAGNWADLVRLSADLLCRAGTTTPGYVDAIFDSIERNGAYMLIAPRVLLAHARPETGALGTGISLVTTSADVPFCDDPSKPARLFFTLAAADSSAHLQLLTHLAQVLVDQPTVDELATSTDPARVAQILNPA